LRNGTALAGAARGCFAGEAETTAKPKLLVQEIPEPMVG
jgi:hypothetical protein